MSLRRTASAQRSTRFRTSASFTESARFLLIGVSFCVHAAKPRRATYGAHAALDTNNLLHHAPAQTSGRIR